MNKGFLLTDATGNVIYVRGDAANAIAGIVIHEAAEADRNVIINDLKTVQRRMISDYMKAKTDEEVMDAFNAWKEEHDYLWTKK